MRSTIDLSKDLHMDDARYQPVYAGLGFFQTSFTTAEAFLTMLLAALCKAPMDRFEITARGLDARIKCERIRAAAKQFSALGPNYDDWLSTFERPCIKLRNKMNHNLVFPAPTFDGIYLGPARDYSVQRDKHAKGAAADVRIASLNGYSRWLLAFAMQTADATEDLLSGKAIETSVPSARLPMLP